MPLSAIEKQEIGDGFTAAGERMGNIESSAEHYEKSLELIMQQLKAYGKAVTSGVVRGEDYQSFWPSEELAGQFGELVLQVIGRKAMGEGTMTGGGALVPREMASWIIQKLGQYGKFRKYATVVPLASDQMLVPQVTADLTIYCPGESAEITESDMSFRQVGLLPKKWCCLTAVSSEVDEDAVVGLGEIIGLSVSRSMAKKEDEVGFIGDGTSTYFGMRGITGALRDVDPTIASIKGLVVGSGNAYSELTLGDFKKVVGILPPDVDENARWYLAKRFYYNVVWALAEASGIANVLEVLTDRKQRYLYGYPIEFIHCMPYTEANSQICALLGDLQVGAYLGERRILQVDRDSSVHFIKDQIAFRAIERIAVNAFGVGDTTEPGPIVGLITAAS